MSERARRRRDFLQNITIALLTVTAVLLFAQTQIYNLSGEEGLLAFLSGPELTGAPAAPIQSSAMPAAPVRVAAASSFGRFGSVTLTTASEEFEPLRGLLEQALDSAHTYTASTGRAFFDALDRTSVYYDFLSPLPLSVLAELVRTTGAGAESLLARRLIVAETGGLVTLYLWDGGRDYYQCDTSLSPETLEETVNQYELGNACFAYESPDPNAWAADPCSLFLEQTPALPELSVSVPLSDADRLLTALDFNPNTQYRYVDSSGATVVKEGDRTLRIHADGTIVYQDSGSAALTVTEEAPTLAGTVSAVNGLLSSLLPSAGDAGLYLESAGQSGRETVLRFGYQAEGVPIRFASGQSAAEVTLEGGAVSLMTFRLRQYTVSTSDSLLLPLRQALAIAVQQEGAELSIGYVDQGGTIRAQWLADRNT